MVGCSSKEKICGYTPDLKKRVYIISILPERYTLLPGLKVFQLSETEMGVYFGHFMRLLHHED